MANLKHLKLRIKSVKSTQKITKAMKLVSASKLRRARDKAEAAAPYADRIRGMVSSLKDSMNGSSHAPELLVGNGRSDVHLFVVVTSDRGLCGGFNTVIIREVKLSIRKLESQGKKVKIFCIGKKGAEQLRREHSDKLIGVVEGLSKKKNLSFADAQEQANKVIGLFNSGEFDCCRIFFNKFISVITQKVTMSHLIPLEDCESNLVGEGTQGSSVLYDYEPGEEEILADILPRNFAVQVYYALLENLASEHGARMSAMDSATRNAGEMIKKLTLVYNRTRQAAITSELIEIISGAEALNG